MIVLNSCSIEDIYKWLISKQGDWSLKTEAIAISSLIRRVAVKSAILAKEDGRSIEEAVKEAMESPNDE